MLVAYCIANQPEATNRPTLMLSGCERVGTLLPCVLFQASRTYITMVDIHTLLPRRNDWGRPVFGKYLQTHPSDRIDIAVPDR